MFKCLIFINSEYALIIMHIINKNKNKMAIKTCLWQCCYT